MNASIPHPCILQVRKGASKPLFPTLRGNLLLELRTAQDRANEASIALQIAEENLYLHDLERRIEL